MSTATDLAVIQIAGPFIAAEELYAEYAYPDPRSPMAKAMTFAERQICCRTGVIPERVAHLQASPWTVGFGDTGPHVKRGTRMSRAEALDRFGVRLIEFLHGARRTWPGLDKLPAPVQAAFLSLAFNRGLDLRDKGRKEDPIDRRREMRELIPAVAAGDLWAINRLFLGMRRVWAGEGMDGLIKRRTAEANLIRTAATEAAP